MAILSSIKKAVKKAANVVSKVVGGFGQAASAAVGNAAATLKSGLGKPVNISTSYRSTTAQEIADKKTLDKFLYSPSMAPIGFSPVSGGGDIGKAQATGQYANYSTPAPKNIYASGSSRSGSSSSSSSSLADSFGSVSAPTTITTSSLAGTSRASSGSSIPLPSYVNAGGGAGALASATSGLAIPATNPDGTMAKFDAATGKPIKDPKQDQSATFFQDYLDNLEKPPDMAALYDKAQRDAGLQQKQQEVANYSSQLNAIQAQAQADQLALTGQGRGIPEAIIGGQQAQIAKEAAIRALPVAAQLAAAQGNLELAQQHVDTQFKLMAQDAQNRYEFNLETRKSVYNFLTAQEKTRLAKIQKDDDRQYNEYQDFLGIKNKLLQNAYAQNAPAGVKTAIQLATDTRSVIAAAGIYNDSTPAKAGSGGEGDVVMDVTAQVLDGFTDLGDLTPTMQQKVRSKLYAQGFNSDTPPKWFENYIESEKRASLSSEAIAKEWVKYRDSLLSTGGSDDLPNIDDL